MMTATMDQSFDWTDNEKLEMSLFAMATLGTGEMLGSIAIGQVIDRYGIKKGILATAINLSIAMILLYAYIGYYKFSALTFFVTFFWGIQDSFLNNCINCIYGFEFESNVLPFSVGALVQSLSVFVFMLLQSLIISQTDYIIYFTCCFAFAYLSLAIVYTFKFRGKKNVLLETNTIEIKRGD
jgi:MFS family permease